MPHAHPGGYAAPAGIQGPEIQAAWVIRDGEAIVTLRARVLLAGLAAATAVGGVGADRLIARNDPTRALSFYNIHTKETVSVTYLRNGKRDPESMKKINWILRDWRKNQPTEMDPELVDLIWQVHTELGSREPIHVISGFRSSDTNEGLRKTQGGQAKNSQHIQGKAADIHFPDVPLKQIRYSGLVRERGGVGYYPTSGVPFVHLDTGRVRHWPRVPRYELALLFPNGQSQHVPADGRPLTREDYVVAKSRYQELAQQVAAFFDLRNGAKQPTLVADAGGSARSAAASRTAPPPPPVAVLAPQRASEPRMASLEQTVAPKLVSAPRPAQRPAPQPAAKVAAAAPAKTPSSQDRSRLASLFSLAAFRPEPKLIKPPAPVERRSPAALASLTGGAMPAPTLPDFARPQPAREAPRVAAIAPDALAEPSAPRSISDIERAGWSTGWAAQPEFDEEHPDEMSYRPFPVAPLLTETASADDPVLTRMVHPNVGQTLEMLGQDRDDLPLALRPGQQVVELLWAQQFQGNAVDLSVLDEAVHPDPIGRLARRTVSTSRR